MSHDHNHGDLAKDFYEEQKETFENAQCGIYAYLDDQSRVCNDTFAKLLGFGSADEWATVDVHGSFPEVFVDTKSQETLVNAYQLAMEKNIGSTIDVSWKKKNGGSVNTKVILVPVMFQGHAFALHFIS